MNASAAHHHPAHLQFVDRPLAEGLPLGVFRAQYRVENLRIVPALAPQVAPQRCTWPASLLRLARLQGRGEALPR